MKAISALRPRAAPMYHLLEHVAAPGRGSLLQNAIVRQQTWVSKRVIRWISA
jgi:hypothetical protein